MPCINALKYINGYHDGILIMCIYIGRYTECLCNFNHDHCVNSKCSTDTSCQRSATVTSHRGIKTDHMFCGLNGTEDFACNSVHRIHNTIEVHYCCTEPYCNGNDTYLFEFIRSRLGVFWYLCVNHVIKWPHCIPFVVWHWRYMYCEELIAGY